MNPQFDAGKLEVPMEQLRRPEMTWPHTRWLDLDTVLVVDRIGAPGEELATNGRLHVHGMSTGRLKEFTAGRAVARRALALLREPANRGILIGTGGEPLWPGAISGSISHTATHAIALVARSTRHTSVGVDLDDRRLIGAAAWIVDHKQFVRVSRSRGCRFGGSLRN
jgi:4'-phosphopantetheinyl transferase EntD